MADIFLARDRVLERPVVIKMLLPQYADDPAFVERFRREATSAAKLNHKNVVAVFDWGSHEDTFYMAMEYIDGQSLADLLVASKQLPVETALAITSEAAAGLGFAHTNGMVHRDVKPGNIMLTETGEVKVADFGIARALDGGESLTQTGNVMGTAAYFSPEQARGETVDRRSDLYSLGVVLFEMVTGQRPFSGSSPVSVAYKHVGEAPPLPTTIDTSLPPVLDAVLTNLLAKDPADRYDNADELRAELQRIGAGQPPLGPAAVRQRGGTVAAAASPGPPIGQGADATAMLQPSPAPHPGSDGATAMLAPDRRPDRAPGPPGPSRSGGSGFFVMALAAIVVAAIVAIVVIGSTLTGGDSSNDAETDTDPTESTTGASLPAPADPADTTTTAPASTDSSSTTEDDDETTTEPTSSSTTSSSPSTTAPTTTTSRPTTTARPTTASTTASTTATTTSTTASSTTAATSEATTSSS